MENEFFLAMQCAGNRRTEMSKIKQVRGVGWGPAAVGTAVWGGVPLYRVLQLAGISAGARETHSGGRHVEFVSVDRCKVRPCLGGACFWDSLPRWPGFAV